MGEPLESGCVREPRRPRRPSNVCDPHESSPMASVSGGTVPTRLVWCVVSKDGSVSTIARGGETGGDAAGYGDTPDEREARKRAWDRMTMRAFQQAKMQAFWLTVDNPTKMTGSEVRRIVSSKEHVAVTFALWMDGELYLESESASGMEPVAT